MIKMNDVSNFQIAHTILRLTILPSLTAILYETGSLREKGLATKKISLIQRKGSLLLRIRSLKQRRSRY